MTTKRMMEVAGLVLILSGAAMVKVLPLGLNVLGAGAALLGFVCLTRAIYIKEDDE